MANFARAAGPLAALIAKEKPSQLDKFSAEQYKAFGLLKNSLVSLLIAKLLRLILAISVDTAACVLIVGCVLIQTYSDRISHPVGIWRRSLTQLRRSTVSENKNALP